MEDFYQSKGVANDTSGRIIQDACVFRKRLLAEENCEKTNVSSNELHAGSNSSEFIKATSPKTFEMHLNKKKKREPISMKSHIQVIAGKPPIYKCNICNKSFKTKSHIYYHDFCSGKVRPLQCDICGSSFITRAHLQYHLRKHSEEITCNECGKRFSHKLKMEKHDCHPGAGGLISSDGIPFGDKGTCDLQQIPPTSGAHTTPMSRGAAVEQELEARLQSLKSYRESQEKIQALRLKKAEVELAFIEQQRRHSEEQFALDKRIKEELFALDKKIKEEQLRELQA